MNTIRDLKSLVHRNFIVTMNNWSIYRHISPSKKVYIGITSKEVHKRWENGRGYRNCTAFQHAINKYGWENIKHEILFQGLSEDKVKSLEINLIRHYKNLNLSYNITDGGDGHLGCSWKPSLKLRKLWSAQRKGRVLTEEWKNKISKTTKGKVLRRDIIEKGVIASKKVCSKPVLQYSTDGKLIKEWPSMKEAARSLGISSPRDIKRCCIGERKTRAGFIWKLKEIQL